MVSRVQFAMMRLLRDESRLAALSCAKPDLLADLTDKSVALVGNARGLANSQHGAGIDAADIVIRLNRAPMPAPASHGTRTDWLALAVALDRAEQARITPRRTLWMSHKRKRLTRAIATSPGFYLHALPDWHALKQTLGAPPSTGVMMIALLADSAASRIDLYGFDFFATKSLTGSRSAAQVPHDFDAEKSFVTALLQTDTRFHLA